jgi:hypothetical protein
MEKTCKITPKCTHFSVLDNTFVHNNVLCVGSRIAYALMLIQITVGGDFVKVHFSQVTKKPCF